MAPALTVGQICKAKCGVGLGIGVEQTSSIISLAPPISLLAGLEHEFDGAGQFPRGAGANRCTASTSIACAVVAAGVHAPGNSLA